MPEDIPLSRRAWVSFQTIVRKEIVRFMRIWSQTLLPPAIQMTLYFVIFGQVLGNRMRDVITDVDYVTFIMPGLVMMAVITNSYANVVSSFFGSKFQRQVEELLVSPTPNSVILCGFMTGGIARGLLVGLAVMVVSLFFTHVAIHNYFVTAAVIVLTAVLFSLGGFLNALFARKFDDISIVPTFVLTPLTYLGGVFYRISDLPPIWQKISMANPIVHMVGAFRYGIIGRSDVNLPVAFGVIMLAIAVLYGFTLHLLNRGVGIRT